MLKKSIVPVMGVLLLLASCGTSSGLLQSSGDDNRAMRNAAISDADVGLNVRAYRFDPGSISYPEDEEGHINTNGEGAEDQVQRNPDALTPCPGELTTLPNIDGLDAIFEACQDSEFVVAHYWGYVTIPGTEGDTEVYVTSSNDDGFTLTLNGESLIDDWKVQGCGEHKGKGSGVLTLTAGKTYPIDAWYMNFHGGYCVQAQWRVGEGEVETIPGSAFSVVDPSAEPVEETTTTTVETATSVETTTTVAAGPVTTGAELTTAVADAHNISSVELAPETTEIPCDSQCVDALRSALGISSGNVSITSAGKSTVLTGSGSEKISITPGAGKLSVSAEGATKTLDIPVAQKSAATTTAVATDTPTTDARVFPPYKVKKNNTQLIVIIVIAVLAVAVAGLLVFRRKKTPAA